MRDASPKPSPETASTAHEAPGGPTVNRVASVATSAVLGGASAGALAGAAGGPVGAAAGAVIGAVAAGFAGNAIVNAIDAKAEEAYWRENFSKRPYTDADADFVDYGPAYRYGVDNYIQNRGRRFDDAETVLAQGWPASRGSSSLDWHRARHASRDSWERLHSSEQAFSGDPEAGEGTGKHFPPGHSGR